MKKSIVGIIGEVAAQEVAGAVWLVAKIWRVAHESAGRISPSISVANCEPVWSMSEPWYCCAEPTAEQFDRL